MATGSNTFSVSGLGSTSSVISAKLLGGTLTVGNGVTVRLVQTMDKTGALTLSLESGAQLGTPAYSSNYPWTLRFSFENAADVVVTGTLSTPAAPVVCTGTAMASAANTCVPPPAATGYTWNNINKVWVANVGVLVTGANVLPAASTVIGDVAWKLNKAAVIKYAMSGFTLPLWRAGVQVDNLAHPIMFAYYITQRNGVDYWLKIPMYVDIEDLSTLANQDVINGGISSVTNDVKGTATGLNQNTATGCFEQRWDPVNIGFRNYAIACPI